MEPTRARHLMPMNSIGYALEDTRIPPVVRPMIALQTIVAQTHAHTHARTHTHTRIHTHPHTDKHTHTHTHTHIHSHIVVLWTL